MPPANKRGQHIKDAREAICLQALASIPSRIEQSAFSSGFITEDNTFSNIGQAGEELQVSDCEEVAEDRATDVTALTEPRGKEMTAAASRAWPLSSYWQPDQGAVVERQENAGEEAGAEDPEEEAGTSAAWEDAAVLQRAVDKLKQQSEGSSKVKGVRCAAMLAYTRLAKSGRLKIAAIKLAAETCGKGVYFANSILTWTKHVSARRTTFA
uniref:Uncharacterized protein n=1 Tax=Peronospora matthiolae TaxID=2874970 RepID=A0AAV1U1L3_9STRA